MYQDEVEEVIHDTLEAEEKAEAYSDSILVKHLRIIVQQEISKRFDEQPTSYNSFKEQEMEALVVNMLDKFIESDRFESMVMDIVKSVLDDCYVEISETAYISY